MPEKDLEFMRETFEEINRHVQDAFSLSGGKAVLEIYAPDNGGRIFIGRICLTNKIEITKEGK